MMLAWAMAGSSAWLELTNMGTDSSCTGTTTQVQQTPASNSDGVQGPDTELFIASAGLLVIRGTDCCPRLLII